MGWEIAAIIIAIVGAATAAYSTYQQGQAEKKASNYQGLVAQNQAEWNEYNAKLERDAYTQQAEIYDLNAGLAEQEAERKAAEEKDTKARVLATQATRYGKAGVMLEGTPLDVMAQTALDADRSIESILYEGGVEAWNWKTKGEASRRSATAAEVQGASTADVYRSSAALNEMRGAQAESTGIYGAGSTILTGAANAMTIGKKTPTTKKQDPLWYDF